MEESNGEKRLGRGASEEIKRSNNGVVKEMLRVDVKNKDNDNG